MFLLLLLLFLLVILFYSSSTKLIPPLFLRLPPIDFLFISFIVLCCDHPVLCAYFLFFIPIIYFSVLCIFALDPSTLFSLPFTLTISIITHFRSSLVNSEQLLLLHINTPTFDTSTSSPFITMCFCCTILIVLLPLRSPCFIRFFTSVCRPFPYLLLCFRSSYSFFTLVSPSLFYFVFCWTEPIFECSVQRMCGVASTMLAVLSPTSCVI